MATEQQGPLARKDAPKMCCHLVGLQRGETFDAVFRQHHAETDAAHT